MIVFNNKSYPYGCAPTSLAQLLLIVAWATSVLTISSCYFLQARPIPDDGDPERLYQGYGFLTLEGGGEGDTFFRCGRYTDFEQDQHIDTWWQLSTALAFFACIVGGFIVLILLSLCCLAFHDHDIFWKMFKILIGCFIMQSLVFIGYANTKLCGGEESQEYICDFGSGSGLNIAAALLWLLAAWLIRKFPDYYIGGPTDEPEQVEDPIQQRPPSRLMIKAAPEPQQQHKMLTAAPQERKPHKMITGEQPKKKRLPRITQGGEQQQSRRGGGKDKGSVRMLTTGDGSDYNQVTKGGRKARR